MDGYDDDPTGPHAHHRLLSDSSENVLRGCRPFAGGSKSDSDSDSSDSEAFRIESTGIFMLSLPDSFEERDDSTPHLYQTPPEELAPIGSDEQRSVGVDVHVLPCEEAVADANGAGVTAEYLDDGTTVDLGRDTDVGLYSEVQSTSETGEGEKSVEIIGVCRSRISGSEEEDFGFRESEVSLGESASKKLKLSEQSSRPSSYFPVDATTLGGGSKVVPVSSPSHNNGDEDCCGKCKLKGMDDGKVSNGENGDIHCNYTKKSAEKKVKESIKNSRGLDDGKVFNGDCNYKEKSAEKEVKESVKNFELPQLASCLLPASISRVKNNAAGKKSNTSEDPIVVTLLEILEILKGEEESEFDEESLSKLSVLDVVQRRGMTFPRPEWWPPEV